MSIIWHKFPAVKPTKTGIYLVFSTDAYQTGCVIKRADTARIAVGNMGIIL